ncbi:unnamed protein product, partial [Iphiclides podalirius]
MRAACRERYIPPPSDEAAIPIGSLTLWPKLASAREDWDEFAYASNVSEEVTDFKILRDGVIAIHKQSAIVFYDIETLKPTERGPITGNYLQYTENDDTIVILGHHLHLFIIRKIIKNHRLETNVTFDNVKIFILVDREVYYVTLNNEICVCNLENFINRVINRSDDGVMSIGFSHGKLHVLTFHRNIYTVNGTDLTFTCELGPDSNLLHLLYYYNFLETLDWRTYHQWMFVFNHRVSDGPLQNIIHVRVYGEVVFVGCNFGVLRIYNSPFTAGELDIYNAHPTKQYNFMERNDCPVLSLCPVFKVDVSESEDGHTVFIGMPKKLAVLNFTHNFNRSASVAMLPYKEV